MKPQSAQVFTNLGIVKEEMGDAAGAREAYHKAVQADPAATSPL